MVEKYCDGEALQKALLGINVESILMVLTLACANVCVSALINVLEMWNQLYIVSTVTLENKDHHSLFSLLCVNPTGGSLRPLLHHSKPYLRPTALYSTIFILSFLSFLRHVTAVTEPQAPQVDSLSKLYF